MNNTVITDDGIEIYENNISLYLDKYIKERNIKDMCKETQGKWNAALMYIKKYVFQDKSNLMSTVNKSMYDEYKINSICDIYINLCYEYDKEISINGFSFLTGIHIDTIYSWGKEEYRGSVYYDKYGMKIGNISGWKITHPNEEYIEQSGSLCSEIYKKLVRNNEESLNDMLISGGRNPMKILPALNRRHNWNMPGSNREGGEQHQSLEEIKQKYLTDRAGQGAILEPPKADF